MLLYDTMADIPGHLLVQKLASMLGKHVKVLGHQNSLHWRVESAESHNLVDCDFCIVDG